MKICYYAWASYAEFSLMIHKELLSRETGYSAVFVVNNLIEKNTILKDCPEAHVYVASEYIYENKELFTYEKFISLELKYSIGSLWKLILSDRFLINFPNDYVIQIGAGYLNFFENVFEIEKPDVFFNEPIAVYSSYAAYFVGRYFGVKYLSPMNTRYYDATHHYYLSDPFQLNMNFNNEYKSSLTNTEDYYMADMYLRDFEENALKPELMSFAIGKPRVPIVSSIRNLYSFLKGIKKPINKYDYINRGQLKRQFDSIIFYFRYLIIKKYFRLDKPNLNQKFVFVPLHYQPEASTLVCAPMYEKQIFLIDSLAKSIPADTLIYVKEHYAFLGHKKISFYRELYKYPNVRLINPWYDSHTLIKHSEAVVVLTGTAGFEAVLYRKPVILLGRIFYENAPGVIKLSNIFNSYGDALNNWEKPKREDVITYLAECFRTMYEGCAYTIIPSTIHSENIAKIGSSLLEQLKRMGIE